MVLEAASQVGTGQPLVDSAGNDGDPLGLFSPPVAAWFRTAFGAPTPPQAQGWPVIARGEHALILSPTGSGKTLTAFLWSLDVLYRELSETPGLGDARRTQATRTKQAASRAGRRGRRAPEGERTATTPGIRVVYVSPLKALNNDVERNLQAPLRGIEREWERLGEAPPAIRVAVRTGDTPAREREAMRRRPPHVLITTPESLYLMLTAERARELFATVHTVIVDEIHTVVGSKRGAHLALSLERLERLATAGARQAGAAGASVAASGVQRIGLSATVRPLENAACFLGGQDPHRALAPRPVTIVDAGSKKALDLRVVTPVDDFRNVPGNSVWPLLVGQVVDLIDRHRTTLVFCNNRRLAERTADRLNEQRLLRAQADQAPDGQTSGRQALAAGFAPPRSDVADLGMFAAGVDVAALEAAGLQPIRAHHGSMSRVARLEMEAALKTGTLPALVATSSLELGIDIGEIDLVVHLQSPKSVGAGLQRVGRSGHLVGQTPKGRIYPTFAEDVVEAAAVARGMLAGEIEHTATPENPLDVLAQHVVAMVGAEDWSYAGLYNCVRGAYPFRSLGESAFRGVLEMLAGKYPATASLNLRPRIAWDRVNDTLTALPASRLLAVRSGGTIPDRGMYSLVLSDHKTKVGELDEEFVFETRVGDNFLLGSQVWKAVEITEDRVIAEPAPGEVPRMPFWRGDYPWRPYDLGQRIGAFRREVAALLGAMSPAEVEALVALTEGEMAVAVERRTHPLAPAALRLLCFLRLDCALDRNSVVQVVTHITRQLDAVGHVATDRTIVVESYEDEVGAPRLVVHSPFGGRVNGPWGIALAGAIRERTGVEAQLSPGDDGILLRFGEAEAAPTAELVAGLTGLTAQAAREHLLRELPASPVFGAQFRMNAARALLLPREQGGKRTPLWLTRLKAKDLLQAVQQFDDFPILLETYRDCLRDVMDLQGLTEVLSAVEQGQIQVVFHESERPSPVAAGLDYRFAMRYVYEYDAPRGERALAALSLNRNLLADLLQDGSLADLLKPEAVADVSAQLARTRPDTRARSAEELAQLLYELGDLTAGEIASRTQDDAPWSAWLDRLAASGRAVVREVGGERRWVSAERVADYLDLRHNPLPIVRRYLLHAGPTGAEDLARRYGLPAAQVRQALDALGPEVVFGRFTAGGPEQWADRRTLEQMHRRTLTLLRKEVRPVPVTAYADFLARWQRVSAPGSVAAGAGRPGDERVAAGDGLDTTLRQLRGFAVPGVAWERDVLALRVPGFDPADLAARCEAGDLVWVAEGGRDPRRARVRFFLRGEGALFLERQPDEDLVAALGEPARAVLGFLRDEGAALLRDIVDGAGLDRAQAQQALVELVLAGLVTNDTLAALHAVLGFDSPAGVRPGSRSSLESQLAARLGALGDRSRVMTPARWRDARRRAREVVAARLAGEVAGARRETGVAAGWLGRWSLAHRAAMLGKPLAPEERVRRQARTLLERWGVVTRACLEREAATIQWDALYPALARLEMRGEARRGYFVEGLPGAQFALPDAVEQLRAVAAEDGARRPLVLSAVDPAQLFGSEAYGTRLRSARTPATAVAAQRGEPVAAMSVDEDGAAVQVVDDHPAVVPALEALAAWWAERSARPGQHLKVDRWQGEPALGSPGMAWLQAAGFVREGGAMLWTGRPGAAG
jgi:ATP-dependent Lhr-like helicase